MYSVVMMMALTATPATPAFGGRCNGCNGCSGCYSSCYSGGHGCSSSCDGCQGRKLFGRRHGCHGCSSSSCHGCSGSGCSGYGCSGYGCAGYGCSGYGSSGYGCSGYGCAGYGCSGYGCAGVSYGCAGAGCAGVVIEEKKPMPGAGKTDGGKEEARGVAPATIYVSLPADAKLMIDDHATTSTSATRVFTSPALATGKEFTYTLKATVVRDGQELTSSKQIAVRAGQESRVTLDFPVASVASR